MRISYRRVQFFEDFGCLKIKSYLGGVLGGSWAGFWEGSGAKIQSQALSRRNSNLNSIGAVPGSFKRGGGGDWVETRKRSPLGEDNRRGTK